MDIFASYKKVTVDLGDGNEVVLKALPHVESLSIAEKHSEGSTGRIAYEVICAHIDSWSGPAFSEFPKPTTEAFAQLSEEFFRELSPHVMKLKGLTEEEGNDSTEP